MMGKTPLSKDKDFIVGEEKIINYFMVCFFLALFIYGLVDPIRNNFKYIDYQSIIFVFALLPAIYCFRRAQNKRIYIRVNKVGIYENEKLLTGWEGLLKVFISQEEKKSIISIKDNFILVVEYRGTDLKKGFRRKIPLTNTQNKSEEEVLEAVMFFWKIYKNSRNC
jgi:hypothetical protein